MIDLETKASPFKRYEIPGMPLVGDVHAAEGTAMSTAWFRDAEGNICCIVK